MGLINIFKPLYTLLQAVPFIIPSNIDNFFFWKNSGMLGFEPVTNHCAMLPPSHQWKKSISLFEFFSLNVIHLSPQIWFASTAGIQYFYSLTNF